MTSTLRAEAEKVAGQLFHSDRCVSERSNLTGGIVYASLSNIRSEVADAIVAFAQHHAEHDGKIERLRGRIDQSTLDVTIVETNGTNFVGAVDCIKWNTGQMRAELDALEKGEVAG
jgi:hypothetical protein